MMKLRRKDIVFCFLYCLLGLNTVQAEDNWLDSFKDLSDKTTAELRLLKHEIYARHGYVFIDAGLGEYFRKKSWYKPSDGHRNENFNEEERKIFQEIYKYEREAEKKAILKNKYNPEKKSILVENAYWNIEQPVYNWGERKHIGWYNSIEAQDYEHVTIWSYSPETNKVHFYAKNNTSRWILNSTLHNKLPSVAGWFSRATDRAGRTQSVFCDLEKGGIYYADQLGCPGPTIGKISSFSDNYRYTSLGIDVYDQPHISFYDVSKGDLMYVALSGMPWEMKEWKTKTLDSVGDVGMFNSLKMDNSGGVHIVYYDATEHKIKYAFLFLDTVKIEDVAKQVNEGTVLSLALDQNGVPNISYYGSSGKGLRFATRAGGIWRNYSVDPSTSSGYYSSAAVSKNGAVNIAYYDGLCKCLKFAFRDKEKWMTETVDTGGDVGEYVALALDNNGMPHIAYYDESAKNLKYAVLISSETEKDLAAKKKVVQMGTGISVMVPFDDITPPKTHLDFFGRSYSSPENGMLFISKNTYLNFSSNDWRECGDVSGVSVTYCAINTNISGCVKKDYSAALSTKDYFKQKEDPGPWSQEISTSSYCGTVHSAFVLPEGRQRLSYLSLDHAGNYEFENSTSVYVDGTPPQTMLKAKDGYFKQDVYWVKSGIDLEITAIDPDADNVSSGVGQMYYLVDEEPVVDEMEGGGAGFNVYEGPFILNPGDHTVNFMAMDNVGNAGAVQSINLHVY